jgi:hypothetical protein
MKRRIRMSDIEAWEIELSVPCYLLLLDMRRPSTLEDYPYLKGIEDPDEFGRDNYIKVFVIASAKLPDEDGQKVEILVDDLIDHVAQIYCDWNAEEIVCRKEEMEQTMHRLIERYKGIKLYPDTICKYLNMK